jgi:hypothetical protein
MGAVGPRNRVDEAITTETRSWGADTWLTCSLPTATRGLASMVRLGRPLCLGSEY